MDTLFIIGNYPFAVHEGIGHFLGAMGCIIIVVLILIVIGACTED